MKNSNFTINKNNKITRLSKRGAYDKKTVYSILDATLNCTVAFVSDGIPFQIPTLFCRIKNTIYIHGSVGAGYMMKFVKEKSPVNVCVNILDGLVLARSAFHHSANYRSVIIFSNPKEVKSKKLILKVLIELTNRIHPERWNDVRPPSKKELLGTKIIAFPIYTASAKVRIGPPSDDEADYKSNFWAGVIPIETKRGKVIPDPKLDPKIKIPKYLK